MVYRFINPFMVAPGGLTWTFIGSATASGDNVDLSSLSAGAIAAGDLCIIVSADTSGTTPDNDLDSGFTADIDNTGSNSRGIVASKKLAGTETIVTAVDGGEYVAFVFRPSVSFTTITANDAAGAISSTNPASNTITASGAGTSSCIVIGVAFCGSSTAAFSTASPAFDATVTNSSSDIIAGYKIYGPSAAVNHTIDMNDLGAANWLAGAYYTVT